MIELKIAEIEENNLIKKEEFGSWRFVLAKKDNIISLYAGAIPDNMDNPYGHADVVRQYNLLDYDILAGGDIVYGDGDLEISGLSFNFGPSPNQVMEDFAKIILEEYGEKYKLKKIEINMFYDDPMKEGEIEKWKKLGYSFDGNKRVIENI